MLTASLLPTLPHSAPAPPPGFKLQRDLEEKQEEKYEIRARSENYNFYIYKGTHAMYPKKIEEGTQHIIFFWTNVLRVVYRLIMRIQTLHLNTVHPSLVSLR